MAAEALDKIKANSLDERQKAQYFTYLGKVAQGQQRFPEALEHFYEAIEVIRRNGLNDLLPRAYVNVASVLTMNRDLANSTKYYRFALDEAQRANDVGLIIDVYKDLCLILQWSNNGRLGFVSALWRIGCGARS